MNLDYFTWIANLGVVPLFLLDAFLLAPDAFFLFALLIDVTAVLETMINLLKIHKYNEYCFLTFIRAPKVAKFPQCVKTIVAFCIVSVIFIVPSMAEESQIPIGKTQFQRYSGLLSYSVKNPEFVNVHFNKEKNLMAITGLKAGRTEIALNFEDKTQKRWEIFVHQSFKDNQFLAIHGLSYFTLKDEIILLGQIDNMGSYLSLKNLSLSQKQWNFKLLTLKPELEEKIWHQVHLQFFKNKFYDVKCDFINIRIVCLENTFLTIDEKFIKSMEEKWFLEIKQVPQNILNENFEIKLKLVQMEKQNGTDIHLGLDQLSGNLNDFFTLPIKTIIGKNQVLLNSQDINLDVLAEPRINSLANVENQFSIGSEIPFTIKSDNGRNQVIFKFAGLLLKIKLLPHNENFVVQYSTELSKPEIVGDSVAINGNKQQSQIIVAKNVGQKLFEIEFIVDSNEKSAFPGLKNIPLLGKIFESSSQRHSYKKIIGIIQISPVGNTHEQ